MGNVLLFYIKTIYWNSACVLCGVFFHSIYWNSIIMNGLTHIFFLSNSMQNWNLTVLTNWYDKHLAFFLKSTYWNLDRATDLGAQFLNDLLIKWNLTGFLTADVSFSSWNAYTCIEILFRSKGQNFDCALFPGQPQTSCIATAAMRSCSTCHYLIQM